MKYSLKNIEDFLANEAFIDWVTVPSVENDVFWQNWLNLNPDQREIAERARVILENIDFPEKWTEQERSSMWDHIQAKVRADRPVRPLNGLEKRWFRFAYAAAVAVLLVASGLFYWIKKPMEIHTAYGNQRQLTLSDGTKIILNANSTLTYGRNFEDAPQREVWISGEAFFNVAKVIRNGKKVPFTVHTDQLDIQVLGTAFNISNRRGRVDVALEHGAVKLIDAHNKLNTMLLKPGEKATKMTSIAPIEKEKVDVKEYTSWKQKMLHYKRRSLKDLAQMIYDTYGIEVIIENKELMEETFTGSFPSDSVAVFFDKLGKLYPVEITKRDGKYYLK
jgi:transmembrane sensor